MAGTGSIAYGQNKFGTEARAGGWDDGGFLMKALVIGWEKRWSCFQKESDGRGKKRKVTRDFPIQF